MAVKYIQKNKNGLWAISNSKTGKTLRTTNTQKEAITIAGSTKTTEGIMIKRTSGWGPATGWDQQVANSTKSATTLKEQSGAAKKPAAKKPAAKKPVAKKPVAKKPAAKKPVAKKAAPKKVVAKKPVAKKATPKKVVAKAPTTIAPVVSTTEAKKEEPKKVEVKKQTVKEPVAKAQPKKGNKKGLPAWAGLLIGLLIIGVVLGGAFLLAYFL